MRVALPNKGRLADELKVLFADAGLEVQGRSERALKASLGGEFEAIFLRTQDIPEFIADGAADIGITGWDLVQESNRSGLTQMVDLELGRCRLVLAGRDNASSPAGKRIATSFPKLAHRWLKEKGIEATVVHISGAAEIAPHLGIAEWIIDLTSTGSTLAVNGLVERETILESSARLIARDDIAKTAKAQSFALALSSVVRARGQRYLLANVPKAVLAQVRELVPGLNGPTLSEIFDSERFIAMQAVVPAKHLYVLVDKLRSLGCEGILVMRIERSVP